jgi:hypothetical protein
MHAARSTAAESHDCEQIMHGVIGLESGLTNRTTIANKAQARQGRSLAHFGRRCLDLRVRGELEPGGCACQSAQLLRLKRSPSPDAAVSGFGKSGSARRGKTCRGHKLLSGAAVPALAQAGFHPLLSNCPRGVPHTA